MNNPDKEIARLKIGVGIEPGCAVRVPESVKQLRGRQPVYSGLTTYVRSVNGHKDGVATIAIGHRLPDEPGRSFTRARVDRDTVIHRNTW